MSDSKSQVIAPPSVQEIKRRRRVLIMLIAVTVAPVLASYSAYYFWKPQGGRTYGELLPVQSVQELRLSTLEGQPGRLADFKGRWLLVMADSGQCAASCQETLFALRQIRMAQGKDMNRLERLWLLTDGVMPDARLLARSEGVQVRKLVGAVSLAGKVDESFYLIDPLGNQVMRYPRNAEPVKVIKEVGKFLKNNPAFG